MNFRHAGFGKPQIDVDKAKKQQHTATVKICCCLQKIKIRI